MSNTVLETGGLATRFVCDAVRVEQEVEISLSLTGVESVSKKDWFFGLRLLCTAVLIFERNPLIPACDLPDMAYSREGYVRDGDQRPIS